MIREGESLSRLKSKLPEEWGPARLRVESWINTVRVIVGMLDEVIRRLEQGLEPLAMHSACEAYEYVYKVLSREPDSIYSNLQRPIASIAAVLQSLCRGDERQRPLPRPSR